MSSLFERYSTSVPKKNKYAVGSSSVSLPEPNSPQSYFPPIASHHHRSNTTASKPTPIRIHGNTSTLSPITPNQTTLGGSQSTPNLRSPPNANANANATQHGSSKSPISPQPVTQITQNPRLQALAKWKCTNPTCLHNHTRSISLGKSTSECMHTQAARVQLEGMHVSQEVNEGLDILKQLDQQFKTKKRARKKLGGGNGGQSNNSQTRVSSSELLPNCAKALSVLLAPPKIDMTNQNNVIDAYQFDEFATAEAKRARQIAHWQERSAKPYSVCELPLFHPRGYPSPVAKRTPVELQALQRIAQSRDTSILGAIFAFLPTYTLQRVITRVSHLWRVCTQHDYAWEERCFIVGDLTSQIEIPIASTVHDGHLHAPRTLAMKIRKLPAKGIRDKLQGFCAATKYAQVASDLSEFKLDQLLLFPNLTRLTLELGAINGGATLRQKALNSNRMLEDVITTKQLRNIKHFHLESNPVLTTSSTALVQPSSTLSLVQSESRAASWLRQMLPYMEDCRTFSNNETTQTTSSTSTSIVPIPSVIPLRPHRGVLTLDFSQVLFQGCWILKVLEKSNCNSLETLKLSMSFAAANPTDKPTSNVGIPAPEKSSTSSTSANSSSPITSDPHAATLGQQRLSELFHEVKVIPALFRTFSKSLTTLELNLENDKVLAREKMTESTTFLIFFPILKQLKHLRVQNLKLVGEGGSVVPYSATSNALLRQTPPIHSSLFHIPIWKHLQRIKRLDTYREELDLEHPQGELRKKPGLHAAFESERDEETGGFRSDQEDDSDPYGQTSLGEPGEDLAEVAARAARKAIKEKNAAQAAMERRKKRDIEREARKHKTPLASAGESDANNDDTSKKAEEEAEQEEEDRNSSAAVSSAPIFTTLCLNDYKICKCSVCQSKMHHSLSTFSFIMNYISPLQHLQELQMEDLAISDFATVVTTTTTTTTTTLVKQDPPKPASAGDGQGRQLTKILPMTKQVYRRQVAAEFTVLSTTSTVTFSSCAPFLLLTALHTLTLPISCYEYDPSTNLVDSICLLLGSRIKHLSIIMFGNGWPPQAVSLVNGKQQKQSLEEMYEPMPLIIKGTDQPKILPYPKLVNLDKLTGLISLKLRRDTHSLSSLDPVLPVLPLIQSLSLTTSPFLVELLLDGFALNQDDVWRFLACSLGGEVPPVPVHTSEDWCYSESDEVRSLGGSGSPSFRSPHMSQMPSAMPSAIHSAVHSTTGSPSTTSRTIAQAGSNLGGARSSLPGSRMASPQPHPVKRSHTAQANAAPVRTPGLRKLSLHNYYGTLTGGQLLFLRDFPQLHFFSIGNRSINEKLNLHNDTIFQSFTALMSEIHSGQAKGANSMNAGALTHPLTAPHLTILSELLPQLRHLELINQENLTNAVFRYWSETEPIPHSDVTRGVGKSPLPVEANTIAPTAVVADRVEEKSESKASMSIVVSTSPSTEATAVSSPNPEADASVPTSPAAGGDDSTAVRKGNLDMQLVLPSPSDASSTSHPSSSVRSRPPAPLLPPFPHLVALTLVDCRPLGYAGLIQFGRAKLQQLDWIGLEPERRLMQPVQQALGQKANLQFKKGLSA